MEKVHDFLGKQEKIEIGTYDKLLFKILPFCMVFMCFRPKTSIRSRDRRFDCKGAKGGILGA